MFSVSERIAIYKFLNIKYVKNTQLTRKVCARFRENYYTIPQIRYSTVHSVVYDTRMNNADANGEVFACI